MDRTCLRLILISEFLYPDIPGGVKRLVGYAPFLIESGIELHVVTKHSSSIPPENQLGDLPVHFLKDEDGRSTNKTRTDLIKFALRLNKELESKPTILLHCTFATGIRSSLAILRARFGGVKSAYALTIMPELPSWNWWKGLKWRLNSKISTLGVSCFFALTDRMRDAYVRLVGFPRRKIEVIPNGVDLNRFEVPSPELKSEIRKKFDLADCDEVVLFVGAFVKRKRLDLLLRAWNAVIDRRPNAVLFAVGAQPSRSTHQDTDLLKDFDDYQESISCLTKKVKDPDSVRLVERTDSIEQAYMAADLLVLPSELEGFPNVVLEAMASGVPVLTNRFDGFPLPGDSNDSILDWLEVCNGVAEQWGDQISELLDDRSKRNRLSTGGREWVKENQSKRTVVELLTASCKRICRVSD